MATVTGAAKGGMWSRPLHAIGEEEGDRRPGRWRGMQARNAVLRALLDVGVARMVEGTELHLLHMQPEDDKLTFADKDLYERGWIERSTAGHAAAVVFVQKTDGSWR